MRCVLFLWGCETYKISVLFFYKPRMGTNKHECFTHISVIPTKAGIFNLLIKIRFLRYQSSVGMRTS